MSETTPLVITADAWAGDSFGGAFKIASELAAFAAARGRDVHYVCPAVKGVPGTTDEEGITLWRYPAPEPNAGVRRRYRAHMDGAASALREIAERIGRPFVLNGHGPLPYFSALRCRDIPLARRVMSVHSPLSDEYRANCGGRLGPAQAVMHAIFRGIEGRCYSASDAVQCFSHFIARRLATSFPRRLPEVAVCPGYVDYPSLAVELPKSEARRRLQLACWQTDDLCFFSLRRHAARMGLDRLIRAFAAARRETPHARCRLIIGGEGPQTPMLRELVRSLDLAREVHLIGPIDESVKALHYRAANCFVLPTTALEGFGLIVLEAFAAGTPVIATPVGAIPEVVDGHGTLTDDAGEEAIRRALVAFVGHGDVKSEQGRRDYARSFDRSAVLPRLEAIIMAGCS